MATAFKAGLIQTNVSNDMAENVDFVRGQARLANTLLPAEHWAAASDDKMAQYPHDVARAKALLDAAGFHAGRDGRRFRIGRSGGGGRESQKSACRRDRCRSTTRN